MGGFGLSANDSAHLHSSMERLKDGREGSPGGGSADLHSSMERLKAGTPICGEDATGKFTFQYGEIKSND